MSTELQPREGMMAVVRNRRAMITAVQPYDAADDADIRLKLPKGGRGPLPAVVFDASHYVREFDRRPAYTPEESWVECERHARALRHANQEIERC